MRQGFSTPGGLSDSGNIGLWEYRTLGISDSGNIGLWEYRTLGFTQNISHSIVFAFTHKSARELIPCLIAKVG